MDRKAYSDVLAKNSSNFEKAQALKGHGLDIKTT
jgi:hypothetical protein